MALQPVRLASVSARRNFILSVLILIGSAIRIEGSPLAELEQASIRLYRDKADAVVRVKVATPAGREDARNAPSLTVLSGFLIDAQGHVATNAVPLTGHAQIRIEKNGRSYSAAVIGSDQRSNVGLLRLEEVPRGSAAVDLYSGFAPPEIGTLAFAVTSPLDFEPSPAWGMVTGFESGFGDLEFPFTQTRVNISIGPAEGGSPVFDRRGELLGICVATLPDIHSSYLVPSRALRRIVADLKESGQVRYGSLPVEFAPHPESGRLVVAKVAKGKAAEEAGIQVGDTLLRLNENPIRSLAELRDHLFYSNPGEFLSLILERADAELEFALLLELATDTDTAR